MTKIANNTYINWKMEVFTTFYSKFLYVLYYFILFLGKWNYIPNHINTNIDTDMNDPKT